MNPQEFDRNKKLEDFLFSDAIKHGFEYSPSFAKNIHKLAAYESQINASFNAARSRIETDKGIARSAMPLSVSHANELDEYESSITKTASKLAAKLPKSRGIESLVSLPVSNRGVKIENPDNPYGPTDAQIENSLNGDDDLNSETINLIINENGKTVAKLIPIRKGYDNDSAIVDTIHFVINRKMKRKYKYLNEKSDHDYVVALSMILCEIFGFGVTEKRVNGLHNYTNCYDLGNNAGRVCIGGATQNDTILIIISGKGCEQAKSGWEKKLYDFLINQCSMSRITRIDLAFDDLEGKYYTVDKAAEDYLNGLYTVGSRPPSFEQRGQWVRPNGNGRTQYIGSRHSVRYMRIYEKGMQLGHKFHPWVRIELELKANKGLVIPFEVLINAGAYLSSQYPALQWISQHKVDRLTTKKEVMIVNVNRGIEITRIQSGAAINAIFQLCNGDAQKTIDLIIRREKISPRFQVNDYEYSKTPIHLVDPERGIYLSCSEILELQVAGIPLPQRYYDLVEPKHNEECPF